LEKKAAAMYGFDLEGERRRGRPSLRRRSGAGGKPRKTRKSPDYGNVWLCSNGLLGECLRHHYYDDDQVSQSWLVDARLAVTSTTGRMVPE
jgi:hypothetical protein